MATDNRSQSDWTLPAGGTAESDYGDGDQQWGGYCGDFEQWNRGGRNSGYLPALYVQGVTSNIGSVQVTHGAVNQRCVDFLQSW